jgi:integrase/recombinase XerD
LVSVTRVGFGVQRVAMPYGDAESWTVVEDGWQSVGPVEEFLSFLHSTERSPNTVKAYAHDLRDYFEFLGQAGLTWDGARLEDAGRFVAWLRLPPSARQQNVVALPGGSGYCSAATVNRKLAAVSAFYLFHHRHGRGPGDLLATWRTGRSRSRSWQPMLAHLGPRAERSPLIRLRPGQHIPATLDPEQVAAVIDACGRLRDRLLLTVLAEAGLRIGEALGLRHEDFDAAASLVSVVPRVNANGARAKSGRRQVPVPARVIRLYSDYLHAEYGDLDCDYVFVSLWSGTPGRPLAYRSVYDLITRLREQTGVEFGPHTFRHTYATGLLRRGVPVEVVQRLLGHSSIATTSDTYAHLKVEDARRALVRAGWLPDPDDSR